MRNPTLSLTLVLGVLAVACSSGDDTTPATTTTTHSTTSSSTGGGGSGGAGGHAGGSVPTCNKELGEGGASCTPASYPQGTDAVVVNTVTGDVMDLDGNPAAGLPAEVCGFNVCAAAEQVDASGHLTMNAGGASLTEGLLLYGDGIEWVRLFAPLPNPPDVALGTFSAARLPGAAQGAALVLGQDAVSGDVTLHLDASAYVEFDVLTYCTPDEQIFRAVTIPVDGSVTLPAVTQALGFEMLFGMAPVSAMICPAAKMTVPNAPGWTANAPVEFLLQGTSVFQEWAVMGEWTKVSDGAVSADGLTVSTADGQGIPEIGTIGVRLAPPG